ncbi:MAG: hypothetical protein ACYC3I_03455 [Gemmataceae bacterium]
MATQSDFDSEPRLFFTEPWEPVIVRRGDALGLRALADQFADALAPDLSNRVRDGRWVTILAWCLARSQEVFHASGEHSVATRSQQQARYAWLRPLELMWVARTLTLTEDRKGRQLAGVRSVKRWLEGGKRPTDRFGMTVDQFRAYRQTGMYGGYRLAFRRWPGMTEQGDGWTPGKATIQLAKWLDKKLGAARPPWALHASGEEEDSLSTRSAKLGRGREHWWWLQKWTTFDQSGSSADQNTLPRRKDDEKLPESDHLKPLLFGDDKHGTLRLKVAGEVEKTPATDHIGVCEHLGRAFASDPIFVLLPRFSRLADAGTKAMDLVAQSLQNEVHVDLADVAARSEAASICEELMAAAQKWREKPSMQIPLPHIATADCFADAIRSAQPVECLRALLQHHEMYGGGLRWFVLRNGSVELRTPWRGGSSRYRFRLWPLCRLATQCGVLREMPRALREDVEATEDETSEADNE